MVTCNLADPYIVIYLDDDAHKVPPNGISALWHFESVCVGFHLGEAQKRRPKLRHRKTLRVTIYCICLICCLLSQQPLEEKTKKVNKRGKTYKRGIQGRCVSIRGALAPWPLSSYRVSCSENIQVHFNKLLKSLFISILELSSKCKGHIS